MKYIKEFDYITIYKTDLVTGSLHFSGVCPESKIVYDFILTGHTSDISPVQDHRRKTPRTELERNIMLDGIKERGCCKNLILNCHRNSPLSSSTASVYKYYITKPDSELSFEMVMVDVKNKKYLIEFKNRTITYSQFKVWGTAILEQVKWNRIKHYTDYELIYIHTTTDGYLLNFKLNEYIDNESLLKFRWEKQPEYNPNKNTTEKVDKMIGHIPISKAIIRKFN